MALKHWLNGIAAGMIPILTVQGMSLSASAVQQSDGLVQFDHLPSLVTQASEAKLTSQNDSYRITITLPADAGESLAAVAIEQQADSALTFDLNKTKAFFGTPDRQGAKLDLASVDQVEPHRIQINFAQPINPGSTITLALEPERIPRGSQTYQIGISALPSAANSQAEFLGYQQLITERSRDHEYPYTWSRDNIFPFYNETDHRVLFWDLPPEFDSRTHRR
jgi:hypothetical protein